MHESEPLPGYCGASPGHPWHGPYHDHEYGFPLRDDDLLFERLVLEINQAGLSWLTILKKRDAFRKAYAGFRVGEVARFREEDRERLLSDPGIVRNRLKVEAAISNAARILEIQGTHGSFVAWLDHHHPRSLPDWVRLFKKTFRFTGGEITREFLVSTGYLPGAHDPGCPVYQEIATLPPPWMKAPAPTPPGGEPPAPAP
jgi:DNA-3-methyladenine glycosylase I